MNRIDQVRLQLFLKRVTGAAKGIQGRGIQFFPTGPDADESTWYKGAPEHVPDFSELGDRRQCLETLKAWWEREGLDELVALVEPCAKLADKTAGPPDDAAEVPPNIYPMY